MHKQSGVTLPELLIAMVVVAILAAVAVPNLSNIVATHKMNEAQETIMQVLKNARAKSVSIGTFTTVEITASTRKIQITYANGDSSPADIYLDAAVTINADKSIVFATNGTANPASTITLTSADHASIQPRGVSITVSGLISATR